MEPHPHDYGPETIEVTDARQGGMGKRILYILLASAGAAALLLTLILLFTGPRLGDTTEGKMIEAQNEPAAEAPPAD